MKHGAALAGGRENKRRDGVGTGNAIVDTKKRIEGADHTQNQELGKALLKKEVVGLSTGYRKKAD